MVAGDFFESGHLRYFRDCIERYGFIPLQGCLCGCWDRPETASARRHFMEQCARNAYREREEGFRGTVEFRHRNGVGRGRPLWTLMLIESHPSQNPEWLCLIFLDEIVVVHGRDLRSPLKRLANSEPVIIAEHDPAREQEPWPGVPMVLVESIESYRKRPMVSSVAH